MSKPTSKKTSQKREKAPVRGDILINAVRTAMNTGEMITHYTSKDGKEYRIIKTEEYGYLPIEAILKGGKEKIWNVPKDAKDKMTWAKRILVIYNAQLRKKPLKTPPSLEPVEKIVSTPLPSPPPEEKEEEPSPTPTKGVEIYGVEVREGRPPMSPKVEKGYEYIPHMKIGSLNELERLELLMQTKNQHVLLVGPAGCGKSLMVKQAIRDLGQKYISMSCNPMSALELRGTEGMRATESGGTVTYWRDGPLVMAMKYGVPLMLDEINMLPPDDAAILNAAMAEGKIDTPYGEVTAKEGFRVIGTYNPLYEGTYRFNKALKDRFSGGIIRMTWMGSKQERKRMEKILTQLARGDEKLKDLWLGTDNKLSPQMGELLDMILGLHPDVPNSVVESLRSVSSDYAVELATSRGLTQFCHLLAAWAKIEKNNWPPKYKDFVEILGSCLINVDDPSEFKALATSHIETVIGSKHYADLVKKKGTLEMNSQLFNEVCDRFLKAGKKSAELKEIIEYIKKEYGDSLYGDWEEKVKQNATKWLAGG